MVRLTKAFLTTLLFLGYIAPCFCIVTQTSAPPIVGCPDTFATTITGSNYQWDFGPNSYFRNVSGANFQSAPVQFLSPGTRTVMVTITTGGGPVVDSLVVTVQASASNVSISASGPLCENTFITYTASPNTYAQYAFFVNDSLKQLSASNTYGDNLPNGDSVRVFGMNGTCFTNASQILYINTPPPPVLISSVPSDTICGGQLVVFTALPDTYDTYNFFVGGSLLQQSSSNTYTTTQIYNYNIVHVTVIKNGCISIYWSNVDTMIVKPTPALTIYSADSTICKGMPLTVNTVPLQATVDTFYYYINSVLVGDTTNSSFTYLSLNNNDTLTAIGEHQGCPSRPSPPIVVTVNPTPNVTLASSVANDTICLGTPVTFTASPGAYAKYNFFNGAQSVQDSTLSTYTTSKLAAGDSIYVIATNAGCPGPPSDTIAIVVNPLPKVTTIPTGAQQCVNNTSDTLTGFTPATGGIWSGTGIINDSIGIFDPAQAGTGTFPLVYTYTDPNTHCTNSSNENVTVNALPVIKVTPANASVCQNQSIPLVASGADTYHWSPGATLSDSLIANPIASPLQTITYIVTGTSAITGCSDTATELVTVVPGPTADFIFSQSCARQYTDFFNKSLNATTYEWLFGDGSVISLTNPEHKYFSSDTFHVTLVATSGNCSDTITQPVFVYPAATANFDAFPLYTYNDSNSPVHFINQSTGADSYSWNFGDQNSSTVASPYHYYNTPGQYTITLVADNQYGCNDSITKVDFVTIYQTPLVFIPNAFTPGNPGNNDILHVFTPGAKYVDFRVFDRLGELVYSSTNADSENPREGWNGTFKGKNAPEGVYVYILQVVFDDNTSRQYQGSVTLLR